MNNNICYINGSPRTANCLSEFLINTFKEKSDKYYKQQLIIKATELLKKDNKDDELSKIINSDTIVIATPLYFDSLPGSFLEFMDIMDKYIVSHENERNKDSLVYVCVNSGFIDSMQSKHLIRSVKFFVEKVKLKWGGAISLGAGELFKIDKEQKDHSSTLMKNVYNGFQKFEEKICNREVITENGGTILISESLSESEFRELSNKIQAQIADSFNITESMLYNQVEM